MPFAPPQMPLLCNIWRALAGTVTPPVGPPTLAQVPCQLRLLKTAWCATTVSAGTPAMLLLLTAKTDIRPPNAINGRGDLVECPSGTGRFYGVVAVDDAAKGFPNEFRVALIKYNPNASGMWPFPTP